MQFLNFLKCMKIEDDFPNKVTFRTSHICPVLGGGCVTAGMSMAWQACSGNQLLCFFSLVKFCSMGIALLLCFIGAALMAYGKKISIDGELSQILVKEHSLLRNYSVHYNLEEVVQIEVCPLAECLLSGKTCFWTIKGYVQHNGCLETIYIYSSRHLYEAVTAASRIAKLMNCAIVKDIGVMRELSLIGKAGTF